MNAAAPTLVLASASPRRAELLQQLHLQFEQYHSNVDESLRRGESPSSYVSRLAQQKAQQVRDTLRDRDQSRVILGADTCIGMDERIFGKPANREQAIQFLTQLAGREHTVYSAVHVLWSNHSKGLLNCTKVRMKAMTQSDIHAYCASGEPLGKAGAYAIQGLGAMFIQHISGSYSAVMGLPLYETAELLQQAGITIIRNET